MILFGLLTLLGIYGIVKFARKASNSHGIKKWLLFLGFYFCCAMAAAFADILVHAIQARAWFF